MFTELLLIADKSVGVMGRLKLIMMLSGPGQAQVSRRYRAQCSKEDVVRKTSIPSEGNGRGMSGTTGRWTPMRLEHSC